MENISRPIVYAIVLNYNGADTLDDCLTSIFQSNYSPIEVVVVDNDSKDGSFEQARQRFPRASFIKNPANLGFAAGNNSGLRFALEKFADFVFILNNDALVEKETIANLIKTAEKNSQAGIINPLVINGHNDNIWFAGGSIDWLKMKAVHIENKDSFSKDIPYETQYASGCAMLIRAAVFKKIGLFDEKYFLYYEDTDFSYRAQKAGYKILIDPKNKVRHFEQSTRKNSAKIYWLVLSGLIFFSSHSSAFQKLWQIPYLALRKSKNLFDLFFSKNDVSLQVRKAYRDFKKLSH